MREKFMEVLAEPRTGSALHLSVARSKGDEILEGDLVSEATGRKYPVVRGIPRFVPQSNYTGSFGFQWNRFRTIQLDSCTGATISRDRYQAEVGWPREEIEGQWLLDAGCGAGRFAEIAAARGPKLVALDYSSAVEAAAATLQPFPNACVVQGNLLEPPFRPGSFRFVYCIGVIQHTPDPPAVIEKVLGCLAPGGRFAFTIYGRKPWTRLNGKYLLRPITRRLPDRHLLRIIELTMPFLFPLTDVVFRLPVVGKVISFALPVVNLPGREALTDEQRYQETILDTFDALSPRYDSPMTADEVETALRAASATQWEFKTRVPVNVVGSL